MTVGLGDDNSKDASVIGEDTEGTVLGTSDPWRIGEVFSEESSDLGLLLPSRLEAAA